MSYMYFLKIDVITTELFRRPFVALLREVDMSKIFKQYPYASLPIICTCAALVNISNSAQLKCDIAADVSIKQPLAEEKM